MPWLGSAELGGGLGRSAGFNRYFGRRGGSTKEPLLGRALLITQSVFEASILLAQAINLLLLFQAFGAVAQPMVLRALGLRFLSPLLPMLLEQCRAQLIEQGFDLPSISQRALEQGHQFFRNIPTAALAALSKGENESRMFVATSARFTARTQTGFADLGQGAFDGRPKLGKLLEKGGLRIGLVSDRTAHEYDI